MGKKSSCRDSSDRESWDKIFKTLVKFMRTKQDEVESLLKDRNFLEDKLKTQHENWIHDVRSYEQKLSLKNIEIETMRLMQCVETCKCNLLLGLKERDCSLCNLKLEQAVDESSGFTLNTNKESGNLANSKSLEAEIRKLKLEYEKLASDKKREVSDLLREKDFAWSQFKCNEIVLKKKDDEIAQANTKISSLLSYQEQTHEVISSLKDKVSEMEQLQSSNHEKDEIITSLKAKVAVMETNYRKKDEENSKLSRDVESLKKSRSFAPGLTRCTTTREKGSSSGNTVGSSHVSTKKEKSVASTPTQEEIKSSKRKRVSKTPVLVPEMPKLFTSTFRIPKLKSPSSGAI